MPIPNKNRKPGPRTPSNQLSRSKAAREWITTHDQKAAMETVVSTRQRLFGLSEADAKEGYAGSVVGRLVLNKVIRRDQYDAAKRYLEVRNAYHRAIGAPPDFTQPRDALPASDDPEKAWKAFCGHARRAHEAMMRVLRDLIASERSPAPMSALDTILVKDCHEPSLIGPLRSALNALGRHFGLQVVREAQEAA
jgi:hypothetical protein